MTKVGEAQLLKNDKTCYCGGTDFETITCTIMGEKVHTLLCKDCGKVYPVAPELKNFLDKGWTFQGECTECGKKCTLKIKGEGFIGDASKLMEIKERAIKYFFKICNKHREGVNTNV